MLFCFFPTAHVLKHSWTALGKRGLVNLFVFICGIIATLLNLFISYFLLLSIAIFFAFALVTAAFYLLLFWRPDSPQFLLPLPGVFVTSHWPWLTIVFCWNQLAATPGTRITLVSLPGLTVSSLWAWSFQPLWIVSPQNLHCFSITGVTEHLALNQMVLWRTNTVIVWEILIGSQVVEGISCFLYEWRGTRGPLWKALVFRYSYRKWKPYLAVLISAAILVIGDETAVPCWVGQSCRCSFRSTSWLTTCTRSSHSAALIQTPPLTHLLTKTRTGFSALWEGRSHCSNIVCLEKLQDRLKPAGGRTLLFLSFSTFMN